MTGLSFGYEKREGFTSVVCTTMLNPSIEKISSSNLSLNYQINRLKVTIYDVTSPELYYWLAVEPALSWLLFSSQFLVFALNVNGQLVKFLRQYPAYHTVSKS